MNSFCFSDLIAPVRYDSKFFLKKIDGHFLLFENSKFVAAFGSKSDAVAVKNSLISSAQARNRRWEKIFSDLESNC